MYTQQQIIERFKNVHGEKYDYSKVKYTKLVNSVTIICPIHGEFEQSPHSHLKGQGCPKCGLESRIKKKTNTTVQFIEKARKVHGDKYDYSKVNYEKSNIKVSIICPEHGEFWMKPNTHLNGCGCPKCGNAKKSQYKKMTLLNFIEKARKIHGDKYDYSKVKYVNNFTKTIIICPEHGEFIQSPDSHLTGHGCPKCALEEQSKRQTMTTQEFIKKAREVHGDKYDYNKTIYKNIFDKVAITCPIHGDFLQKATYHLNGNGCQKCAAEMTESKGEIELREFIISLIGEKNIVIHDRKILAGNELDIYIPSKSIAFEYDGLYWHSEKKKVDKNYHLYKTRMCNEIGVRLIHIFEDEWRDKKDICKSRISNILGVTENKIYARKCEIRKVLGRESNEFLIKNHIQGKINSNLNFGLYYQNELVSLMTFGQLRKNLGGKPTLGSYELLRFCNKLNTNVIGGASKLFKYFLKEMSPNEITSYADIRWSDGNLYKALGFEYIHSSSPNYFYIINECRKNRFGFRKNILISKYGCPKEMSEHEFCYSNQWYRIYDCGSMKFIYRNLPK